MSVETVSRSRRYVKRLRVPRVRRVTSVAASILPSHIHYQRFWALRLDFKGGDERVFGVDDYMFGFALQLQSDSELQWGTPNSLQYTMVSQRQRPDEAV